MQSNRVVDSRERVGFKFIEIEYSKLIEFSPQRRDELVEDTQRENVRQVLYSTTQSAKRKPGAFV